MSRFPNWKVPEFAIFKKLNKPWKVQDFLNTLPRNFDRSGDTCRSPRTVLQKGEAQCLEGAMLAAAILWYHGGRPLLMDFKTTEDDYDHVVAPYRWGGRWGAISKTNHAVIRYRNPVYQTIRELAMSYFHEYFLDNGKKTMRSYSGPFSLLQYDDRWLVEEDPVWRIGEDLDAAPHFPVAGRGAMRTLRHADPIERKVGKLLEWKRDGSRTEWGS